MRDSFFGRYTAAILFFTLSGLVGVITARAQAIKAASMPVENTQNMAVPNRAGDYIVGPDDVLNIFILDVPELSRSYRVSNSGSIALPVMGKPIMASGLTLPQLSQLLSQQLQAQGLVVDPHVNISVDQSRLHSVAITGAVKKPQIYPVLSQTTLLDVLSQAEGLDEDAGTIAIIRRGDIGIQATHPNSAPASNDPSDDANTVTVDLKRLLGSGNAGLNVPIYPGDRITVPRAGVIYVVGAVNKPGGFPLNGSNHSMTVLQALALAEDTKGSALRKATVILRNDPAAPDGRKRIPVDLKAVLAGKDSDPNLQAEDILFVPDSAGKRALGRGLESVIQAATGVAIYDAHF